MAPKTMSVPDPLLDCYVVIYEWRNFADGIEELS